MQWFGLDGIAASKKDYLRKRILAGGPYDAEDRRAVLDYCESDVRGLAELFPRIIRDDTNLILPLWRSEYLKVVAATEYTGVPVDTPLYRRIVESWPVLQASVIERVN